MTQQHLNFLKKLYDELKRKGILTLNVSTSKEKVHVMLDYAKKLERVQSESLEKDEYLRKIRELYYQKYIVKESNIPNEYFEHLSKMYLEEGHGHFDLINPRTDLEKELRNLHVQQVINAQKSSLDVWLDYLMSYDSNYIDMEYKIWIFQGILDIGTLSKNLDSYNRRDKNTIAPFVSLNSELLGKSVLYLKMHLKEEIEEYPDENVKRLASSESFYQIYGKLLAKEKTIKKNGNEGIWVKYQGFNEEDALKLYEDLQGYNTGWCTASDKATTIAQICGGGAYVGGDFYVYYTKDFNNEYKIPRIAIRMEQGKIGEVRGIASNQNIEQEMEEALNVKLMKFPDSNEYIKKVSDMRELTKIYKKNQAKEALTLEEIKFLYECENKIEGFGYSDDPRINEIILSRNISNDANMIFSGIEVYNDNISFLHKFSNLKGVKFPKVVNGHRDIHNAGTVEGGVSLTELISAEGITLPEYIDGDLLLYNLKSSKGLVLPKRITGKLIFGKLKSEDLVSIVLPEEVKQIYLYEDYREKHYTLSELKDKIMWYKSLMILDEVLEKSRCKEDISKDKLRIIYNLNNSLGSHGYDYKESLIENKIKEIIASRDLVKDANDFFEDLEVFEGDVKFLSTLSDGNGLKFPKRVNGSVYLESLKNGKGIILPEYIGGSLYLSDLVSAENLILPKYIGGSLDLSELESAKGLVLPEYIGTGIVLANLKSAEGLLLPKSIRALTLGITSTKGLIFPERIESSLVLLNLELDELLYTNLPDYIGGEIFLKNKHFFTFDDLKQALNAKREKINLNKQMEMLIEQKEQNSSFVEAGSVKRGRVSIWYILVPSLTILSGILISYIINCL